MNIDVACSRKMGLDIGPVRVIVYVKLFTGMAEDNTGASRKVFEDKETPFAAQLIMPASVINDPRFIEKPALPFESQFPLGSKVVYLGPKYYGSVGEVVGYSATQDQIRTGQSDQLYPSAIIRVKQQPPPPTQLFQSIIEEGQLKYYPSYLIAKKLRLPGLVLSRLCSSLTVDPGRVDVGLNIKFSRFELQVPDYAKRVKAWRRDEQVNGNDGDGDDDHKSRADGDQWLYSELTAVAIHQYMQSFPAFFAYLATDPNRRNLNARHFVPKGEDPEEYVQRMTKFVQSLAMSSLIAVPCDSEVLPARTALVLENKVVQYAAKLAQNLEKAPGVLIERVTAKEMYGFTPQVAWSPTAETPMNLGDR